MFTLMLLLASCTPTAGLDTTTLTDCETACGVVYGDVCWMTYSVAHPYDTGEPYTQEQLLDECLSECGAATLAHQTEWSACVLDYPTPTDSSACGTIYPACGESPCYGGLRFSSTASGEWHCE